MLARAPERAVVPVVDAVRLRLDEHRRLLVGEEQPVAVPLRQPAPRPVDVDAEAGDDVAQVAPCQAPGQAAIAPSRMLSDGSGHEELLGDVDARRPRPWQSRAGTGHGVGREGLGLEVLGPGG